MNMLFMVCQMVCGQSLYDRSNMSIGKIGSDGYVYDRSNMTVGRFKSDGYSVLAKKRKVFLCFALDFS